MTDQTQDLPTALGVAAANASTEESAPDLLPNGFADLGGTDGETNADPWLVADLRRWLLDVCPELESQADAVLIDLAQLSPALQEVLDTWMRDGVVPTVAVGGWTVARLQESLGVTAPAALAMLGWLERDYAGAQEALGLHARGDDQEADALGVVANRVHDPAGGAPISDDFEISPVTRAAQRLSPSDLVPRLMAEFGYSLALMPWSTKSEAQMVSELIAWSPRRVKEALVVWWATGAVPDLTIDGLSLAQALAEAPPHRPVRAFVRLAQRARHLSEVERLVETPRVLVLGDGPPDEFRVAIGWLEDEVILVQHIGAFPEVSVERYDCHGPRLSIIEVSPTIEAWHTFWDLISLLNLWDWPARTVNDAPFDPGGFSWCLMLQHHEQRVHCSGHTAVPDPELFGVFLDAIQALLGDIELPARPVF